ncbi:MAG: hypothetical protein ABIN69_05040 [Aestuariivirga sp.]
MLKTFFAATAITFTLSASAFADDMMTAKCDDTTMKMVSDAMAKDTDAKMANDVKMAGDEMKMAMDSMKANKMDECTKHVGMAMDHMMMKHN